MEEYQVYAYSFEMEEDARDRLQELADEGRRTFASQLRMAIDFYLDGLEKKGKKGKK